MLRRLKKTIILATLVSPLLLLLLSININVLQINTANAGPDDNLKFTPQVTIPGSEFVEKQAVSVTQTTETICNYLIAIYKYMIGSIAIFAAVALIIGGVIWIMSAGSPGRISTAKDWIAGALSGLALALGAFLLLATINPEMVICRHLSIGNIKTVNVDVYKTEKASNACRWEKTGSGNPPKCTAGYAIKDNAVCKGHQVYIIALGAVGEPYQNSDNYTCCCADNKKLDKTNYCQDKWEGATCRVNNNFGYCEEIKGKLICRNCKEKSSYNNVVYKTEAEAKSGVEEKYRCYSNLKNFECPDKNGICGDLAIQDDQDCNAHVGDIVWPISGVSIAAGCWKENNILNLNFGKPFVVQCRCQ